MRNFSRRLNFGLKLSSMAYLFILFLWIFFLIGQTPFLVKPEPVLAEGCCLANCAIDGQCCDPNFCQCRDCEDIAVCGDATCQPTESCSTCPADCGSCAQPTNTPAPAATNTPAPAATNTPTPTSAPGGDSWGGSCTSCQRALGQSYLCISCGSIGSTQGVIELGGCWSYSHMEEIGGRPSYIYDYYSYQYRRRYAPGHPPGNVYNCTTPYMDLMENASGFATPQSTDWTGCLDSGVSVPVGCDQGIQPAESPTSTPTPTPTPTPTLAPGNCADGYTLYCGTVGGSCLRAGSYSLGLCLSCIPPQPCCCEPEEPTPTPTQQPTSTPTPRPPTSTPTSPPGATSTPTPTSVPPTATPVPPTVTPTSVPGCDVAAPSSYTATRESATAVDLIFYDNADDETGFEIDSRTGSAAGAMGGWGPWTSRGANTVVNPSITGWVDSPDDTNAPDTQCYQWRIRSLRDVPPGCTSGWASSNIVCPTLTTPTPTPTSTPTVTPGGPTSTPIPTSTVTPTPTTIPTPTVTSTPAPTATPTPTDPQHPCCHYGY